MSAGSNLLLLGLKGSGKTSYLAALWKPVGGRRVCLRTTNREAST
jgi:hypothetical protein